MERFTYSIVNFCHATEWIPKDLYCFLLDLGWNHLAGHTGHIHYSAEVHICIWPDRRLGQKP